MTQDPCAQGPRYSGASALLENLPFLALLVMGSVLLRLVLGPSAVGWSLAAAYLSAGVLGVLGIILFLCPHCPSYGSYSCPCGYAMIAARLRPRGDVALFARRFRTWIAAIVPLWFIPPVVAVPALWSGFSWPVALLLGVFVLDGFVLIPLLSKGHGCKQCPQRAMCPWIRGVKA